MRSKEKSDGGRKNIHHEENSYMPLSRFNYFFTMAAAYKSILSDAFFMYTSGTCNGRKKRVENILNALHKHQT
jgi:hypothetical protein